MHDRFATADVRSARRAPGALCAEAGTGSRTSCSTGILARTRRTDRGPLCSCLNELAALRPGHETHGLPALTVGDCPIMHSLLQLVSDRMLGQLESLRDSFTLAP
jgi:hypothetical protein